MGFNAPSAVTSVTSDRANSTALEERNEDQALRTKLLWPASNALEELGGAGPFS